MPTDTKERGLETLIVDWLVTENRYEQGGNADYNRACAMDTARLFRFLKATQPLAFQRLGVEASDQKQRAFLERLQGEITKRGIVDVLRKGVNVYPAGTVTLFYQTPSERNAAARERFERNIFSVTRQLKYSETEPDLALDFAIFINGLPLITCELKNELTKQDVDDAVRQYKRDRSPRELIFQFKRCMVHFAADDARVKFCTKLAGADSWFLPFDKGWDDGAGNPPNPDGLKTDYLWKNLFRKEELANVIENFAQVIEETDADTGRKTAKQIFPRYHQWDVVKALLADVREKGVGGRYLIQHSAGSGKSNSIAWLAHQLIGLEHEGRKVVDSVIVVTDRVNLDRQIRNTIKHFMQVSSTVAWAETSQKLQEALRSGKRIIVTTVHKFQYILKLVGSVRRASRFGIIIDEAHSSQSGSLAASMNAVVSGAYNPNASAEDLLIQLAEGRRLPTNASYFAFTATPKNKTLEMFGLPYDDGGVVKHRPFHVYTMKQAIQEGFILDVLQYYTPYQSYYKLAKTVEDDPLFDKKRAQKRLRCFVEGNEYAIAKKAEVIVEHFHVQVAGKAKIGGKARAMVIAGSIDRAIEYYLAINRALAERKSPYKTIIAFSGEKEFEGRRMTEADFNGFPSNAIEKTFKEEPYRFLVVADKFQTGYDEPLLHTMYVDKVLSGIKAVQTLSRLNRACPKKTDTFVLDFANTAEDIKAAFDSFYRTTLLSGETDPNKLYDLVGKMEKHQVFSEEEASALVRLYLSGASRERLDPILDVCVERYKKELSDDDRIEFKGAAKSFVRTYGFLGAVLPYGNETWERLSIFLNLLVPKLPSPDDPDLAKGILEAVDLESYRLEAGQSMRILLTDEDSEVGPVPIGQSVGLPEAELDPLSRILTEFNDLFGNIAWENKDQVRKLLTDDIPRMVSDDPGYQNAVKNSDEENARIEVSRALSNVMFSLMADNVELYKQFSDNNPFRRWLENVVFARTYRELRSRPKSYLMDFPTQLEAAEQASDNRDSAADATG